MATRSGPNYRRVPALRGGFVVDTTRGAARVRVWPRKRGKPKHPATLQQNAWWKTVMHRLKYADGLAYDWAIRATKQTGLYPRDLLTRCMTKGLFLIPAANGDLLTPRPIGIYSVMFQGARVGRTTNLTVAASTLTAITWQTATFDTAGMFDPTQPTRLTIPAGVNIVNLTGIATNNNTTSTRAAAIIRKNGTTQVTNDNRAFNGSGGVTTVTGPIPVVAGDYFEFLVFFSHSAALLATLPQSLSAEILDASLPV